MFKLIKLHSILYHLRASFWFLPALMAGGAVALSSTTMLIDRNWISGEGLPFWLIFNGDPESARTVLSVIAGSMMTVAGVVFSITIVVLSLASSQFGPRLIRNFMNVRANQIVLGTFVATFIYSLLVLHGTEPPAAAVFVPRLSVSVSVALSLVSLALLIFFIHSVSESIQAENIIARVRRDLEKSVERLFPEPFSAEDDPPAGPIHREYAIPTACDRVACQVKSEHSGYLQALDNEALMRIAQQEDLLIHLGYRPGDFIAKGSLLVTVWPGARVDDRLSRKINALFIVGAERTLEQDAEFAISQLVEIAVRALSPGINDPITAITCIDWLGASLCQLANRRMPASHRFGENHRLRVICKPFGFEGMVDAAFNMIRQNSQGVAAVSIRLLETIAMVAAQTAREEDRAALRRHAAMVAHGCKAALSAEGDLRDLEKRYRTAIESLGGDREAVALASGPDSWGNR
jgi:uncharacterized membrane protein